MWEWNTAGAFLTAGYSAWSDSQYLQLLTTAYSDFSSRNKPLLLTWPLPSWEWCFVRVQYLCDSTCVPWQGILYRIVSRSILGIIKLFRILRSSRLHFPLVLALKALTKMCLLLMPYYCIIYTCAETQTWWPISPRHHVLLGVRPTVVAHTLFYTAANVVVFFQEEQTNRMMIIVTFKSLISLPYPHSLTCTKRFIHWDRSCQTIFTKQNCC